MEIEIEAYVRGGTATAELENTFREWRRWRALNRLRYWRNQTVEEERLWAAVVRLYELESGVGQRPAMSN
jgi:hypothetical protein